MARYSLKRPAKAQYRKYGCLICADYRHDCDGTQPCKYAAILDRYDSYAEYDKAAKKILAQLILGNNMP